MAVRLSCLLVFVSLVVVFVACDCATGPRAREVRRGVLSDSNKFLRSENNPSRQLATASRNDEERMAVREAFMWFWNAVKIRVKMKFWLFRGKTPEEVLKKLKVTNTADKNHKYYSKYFFRYYVKYPGRQPPNLPTRVADGIMQARLRDWLEKKLSPPQVFKEMGFTGTFASARGDPQFKFFKDYSKMWSNLQVRLVKESDEAMKTRLDTWLEKQLTPPQVFKKLGLTGSFESSRDHPDYKYFEQYSKMWSNLQVRVSQAKRPAKSAEDIMIDKLYYWLKKELTPPQVFKKMGFTGTFASASGDPKYKYFVLYNKMWNAAQAGSIH
ncbi:secreted RxLR effector peptide protein, putative [Phytophthora infestans T30-4]|uniref:RxLR effector protein n=1 Tax=Phytophthora infestans (strain T30-4) TaxID=403677 RepID=D0NH57_PHYIT|nr:secreted RxLR effector peptide protein, putative [Phytophthora infestans T30-4]EEY58696.1 secreted RxLR effector peptide protein, putative [Phytophthora infestans T30-4]|eukprot:XP_002901640.1 secreted RxLR effector peptide protein, putative [Phytophthora infestans T30-4]